MQKITMNVRPCMRLFCGEISKLMAALLHRQADVCARDEEGRMPLALASRGFLDEVEDAEILLLRPATCPR